MKPPTTPRFKDQRQSLLNRDNVWKKAVKEHKLGRQRRRWRNQVKERLSAG